MNPLMQAMNSGPMANMAQLKSIMGMLRSGNPEQIAQNLMMKNPQFKAFVEANKGKTPEQVAQEHGVNLSAIMKQM